MLNLMAILPLVVHRKFIELIDYFLSYSLTYFHSGRFIPEPYTPPYVSHQPDIHHITLEKEDR